MEYEPIVEYDCLNLFERRENNNKVRLKSCHLISTFCKHEK